MSSSVREPSKPTRLAADIVAAYVANNSVPLAELPALIHAVRAALERLANGPVKQSAPIVRIEPAVSVRKSITADYLVCLEDGRKFKSLRRHLRKLGLTPDEYREKWNLPDDYPMVAATYSAARSQVAKQIGLGQMGNGAARKPGRPSEATVRPRRS